MNNGFVYMTIKGKYIYESKRETLTGSRVEYEEVSNVNAATVFTNANPSKYKLTNITAIIPATEERIVTLIPI